MSIAWGQGFLARKEATIALTIERWIRWGNATSVRAGNVAMMLLKLSWHGPEVSLRKEATVALAIEKWILRGNTTNARSGNGPMMLLQSEGKTCP